jgi:hypothetical protein
MPFAKTGFERAEVSRMSSTDLDVKIIVKEKYGLAATPAISGAHGCCEPTSRCGFVDPIVKDLWTGECIFLARPKNYGIKET